jgi:hypothetical protein
MYRSILIAAVAALSLTGAASAQPANFSVDDADICRLLEEAHETTCAEYNLLHTTPSIEFTGSLAPSAPEAAEPVKPRRLPGLATSLTGSGSGGETAADGQPKDEPRSGDGGYDGSGTPGPVGGK